MVKKLFLFSLLLLPNIAFADFQRQEFDVGDIIRRQQPIECKCRCGELIFTLTTQDGQCSDFNGTPVEDEETGELFCTFTGCLDSSLFDLLELLNADRR